MKVAVISDVHGNWEALEAVWEDLNRIQVDAVDCLGDVVGYGADPAACLDFIDRHCRVKILGNHEQAVLRPAAETPMNSWAEAAARWTCGQLSQSQVEILSSWPVVKMSAEARWTHGSPREPAAFHYIRDRIDAEVTFGCFSETLCFVGHTHQCMVAEEVTAKTFRMHRIDHGAEQTGLHQWTLALNPQCRMLFNPGSVGQPRDSDPRARWLLLEDQPFRASIRFVPYNIEKAQWKIRKAGLPDFLAERIAEGR